ncbi:ferrichrome-iron receptor [Salegentibacter salinarum]|uniref:Ferrichrome-iron receptor n=1 Tax=Salegentibacter salinarum TaxID=447422 RepID=A0A2N0TV76_9FLAO|nr:TonB-dependent receptor [Salegentibacter salinarum]PKD18653.1 ferrichrome-iron receptor [Salegentibacter salinarum]SKB99008.1 iron complex outermembrane recepter protein [Salegentibacter salinarum]
MKRFLFLSLLLFTSYTYSQQVKLSGKLIDQKDDPIPYANVVLENTNYGTTTNQDGEFEVKARPGTYILVVSSLGYGRFSQKVVLDKTSNDLGTIILTNQTQSLNEVAINSHHINRFSDKRTDYVARMPLENLENPQVYSVISKELMQEQVVTDIGQTVRNATGVVPIIYPSGGLATTFRGFNVGINARNGMETTSGRSGIDIANVERIEILKGPSGTLFGGNVSSFGGVVNLVTKKPMEARKNEISYTTGSYNLNRITADINNPLNKEKTVLFRLNTALNKEKSFLDYGFYDAYLIAPSFLFKASDRLTFTLDTELLNVNSTRNLYNRYAPESGITSPEDLKLDYNKALFHNDADAQTASTKIFAEAKYQLAENWTSSTLFSFVGEDVDHSYQYYATWLSPTVAQRESGNWNSIYNNYTNLQENINGEFSTGNIKHKVLIGASYRSFQSRSEASRTGTIDTIDVSTDFHALRKEDIDPHLVSNYWPGWNAVNSYTLSGYATDVIDWTDRLSTMLSLRIDHFDREAKAGAEGFQQTALSPKLGLVYQVVKDHVSVFGNYMNGFQNQAPRTQPDGSQFVLDPVYAEQSEGGIKAEVFDKKLSATASFYHIAINNAIRTNTDGFAAQDGEQVSKGIDVEVIANPFPGLNIISGYAYNDNRIIKSSDESIEGNKAVDSPENVANFWASYTFQNKLKGLGFGVGGNHVGQSYMFSDNVFSIPAYTVYNASLFYNQPSWRIGLKINNLTDEKYWTFWGVRQVPANFAANLTFRF